MKKIAFAFFLIFSLVQVMPAMKALYPDNSTIFMVEDEKSQEKNQNSETKEKKIFSEFPGIADELSHKLNTALHVADKIHPFPCLEKFTPPPNFC
jgi:hypothetical protein